MSLLYLEIIVLRGVCRWHSCRTISCEMTFNPRNHHCVRNKDDLLLLYTYPRFNIRNLIYFKGRFWIS